MALVDIAEAIIGLKRDRRSLESLVETKRAICGISRDGKAI